MVSTDTEAVGKRRYDGGLGLAHLARDAQRLEPTEAVQLLACVSYGRVVFTLDALPAIRPVNHLVDDGQVIIRTRLASAISTTVRSTDQVVVAYEADSIDPRSHTGWSVVITGRAVALTDVNQIARYEQLLHPWVNHADTVVAITPDLISGFRLTARA